ncbi:Acid-sensing ion channel 2 [Desmophyllum pertusum]|uniref:Acid-sensing ion channel 2 n=1 Tax=Desmophyllum pertusum TaxID=174260 RepID=A0A9W9YKL2_9CNID|nr:Acid-sensing ion channel 2 [Desmophyllum pertusum]
MASWNHPLSMAYSMCLQAGLLVGASSGPCFLLLGMGWFSFQSFKLLAKYFSYPVTTKVTLVYEDAPDFPAVSICNFNMFRRSVVNANGYGQLLKYVLRRSHGFDTSNDTVDTSKGGQQILKVKQAGTDFGLHLILDVQQHDYVALGYRAGLKILIHHPETPPVVSQLGFAVGPGTSTYSAIHKQRVINLPKPYESNCLDNNDSNMPGYTKYTTLACMLTCQTKYVVQKCGCREVGMPHICVAHCEPKLHCSQNWLELTVYFQELNYHVIEQKPAYDSESLLAEIGGQVGLCVGASLLTVLEFCDVLLAVIGIRLGFR